ncbi:MAG: c-type cytochrome [Bryobacteraceae bacterium]
MRMTTGILVLGLAAALAQQPPHDASLTRGVDLYLRYCAVCHGRDAKGAGPAASALKTPPTDLTQLTRSHAGKFPVGGVRQLLGGGSSTPAHGSADMPMWGPVFRAMQPDQSIAKLRVDNLLRYLESIQEK